MRAHLYDSLDEIAEELRVPPRFILLARAIDKEFSLCANYTKGHGAIFQEWMKDNHPGELLLYVERALSGGRQDIAYCVDGCYGHLLEQKLLCGVFG